MREFSVPDDETCHNYPRKVSDFVSWFLITARFASSLLAISFPPWPINARSKSVTCSPCLAHPMPQILMANFMPGAPLQSGLLHAVSQWRNGK